MKHPSPYSLNDDVLAAMCRAARRRRRDLLASLGRSGFRLTVLYHARRLKADAPYTWRELATSDRFEFAVLLAWLGLRRSI
jgi:hypothetical protein